MKKLFITTILALTIVKGYAQNKHTEKADNLFQSYQYVSAIDEYLKLTTSSKADAYAYKKLADSYYNIFNMEEAAKWYAKAITKKQDAETYYKYAQCLKAQGKYQEANQQMVTFSDLEPNDSRAKEFKANPNYIPTIADKDKLFDVGQTTINSKEYSDFGAFLDDSNTLYFVSTRNTSNRTDKWVDQPYLDIYQTTRSTDGKLSEAKNVSELNSSFHDGPVTISADGNTLFFARDGHAEGAFQKDKKSNTRVSQQGIYKTTKVDGKWTNIQALPFNSKTYSVSHPSLSKDGKTLYFASNMPGGLGDTDIWKVSVNGSTYGKPENLGASVNTSDKEGFPFISDNGVLYFSSRGHQGFGGLDVYKIETKTSSKAINLGKPVNTANDDFSFNFNTKHNAGYFSSNRDGVDNIYTAIPVCKSQLIAIVKDKSTGNLVSNATVEILDDKSNSIASKMTNSSGEVTYDVNCNTTYKLQVSKLNYEIASQTTTSTSGEQKVTLDLEPSEVIITDTEVILKPIYFDFNKSNITEQGARELDKLVAVMKEHSSMVILVKSHTDTKGSASYNLKLSEERAQSTVQYLISKGISTDRVSGKGLGFSEPKVDCKSNCTDEQDSQNRRSEFKIVKR
jgi:outer membrane protein OmpA-like peptidoglycan-associated protein/tetratricopeptide (TPR) repeat protein